MIVTVVPFVPVGGFRLVIVGTVPTLLLLLLKAANPIAHVLVAPKVAVEEAAPAKERISSSVIKSVFDTRGRKSSSVYPDPAVKLAALAVITALSSKSPFAVVVAFPLVGEILLPAAETVVSNEL